MRQKLIQFNLFLVRIASALILFIAGGVKLFGWFNLMPSGAPLPTLMLIAGILEVVGGMFIALGLFTRPVAFILSGEMAFAYFLGHYPMGMLPIQNHGEAPFLLCFIFFFLFAYGAGTWSLDRLITSKKQRVQ